MEDPTFTPSSDDANSSSQIQPSIEIDVIQVIPQVTGGNVFASVTILLTKSLRLKSWLNLLKTEGRFPGYLA